MPSQLQNEANRRNALKSTGPKTPEGKAIASRNAVTHGLSARMPVIPGENEAEFQTFTERWLGDLKPAGPMEEFLAERIIGIAWRLRRTGKIETECFKPEVLDTRILARLNRYESALERSFYRNMKELHELQAERAASPEASEADPTPVLIEKFAWVFVPAPDPVTLPGFSETPPPAPPEVCV